MIKGYIFNDAKILIWKCRFEYNTIVWAFHHRGVAYDKGGIKHFSPGIFEFLCDKITRRKMCPIL